MYRYSVCKFPSRARFTEQPLIHIVSLSKMSFLLATFVWGIVGYSTLLAVQTIVQRYSRNNASLHNACKEPSRYPFKDKFWGSDLTQNFANARKRGDVSKTLRCHFSRYGKTYKESPLFGKTVINTMDIENVQAIAALKANDFGVEPTRKFGTPKFTGDGVLSTDGAAWKHSRAIIRPTFSRREIADLDFLKVHTDRMLALLPKDNETTDLQPLLKRLVCSATICK
jgi:hypothetical protein